MSKQISVEQAYHIHMLLNTGISPEEVIGKYIFSYNETEITKFINHVVQLTRNYLFHA